ncbi:LacI family DNA-binding transcriptional regulator [Phytohabitans sp. ZYX-F-186]|uniref:LacI family DNA-binding transcriptional regulator n=1 Tax=Phytohabitans maris TaxID=3071409 RepID=A0ABU0ZAM2_9ACTN|nr:LacI family DNA-binding transcriptional regulator [Phytohabitans sp. ZYX-F-186]MDQ7904075.1 LacI family DNA-binding transcriptional regulator [Phytohabitans sp. ZYX-F-186]
MTTERLFGTQRQERLLAELRGHGAVRVRDLARELGVSELTIRRDIAALAERGLVSKVHGGATLPAHRPAVGQPRRVSIRFTIGMVVPSLDFYWPPVVAGARAAAAALGVTIQLRGSSYDPDEDRRQVGRLVDAGEVHGLLLAPGLDADAALPDWLDRLALPAILLEREPRGCTAAEWVRTDHAHGLDLAVRHLCQQGHRRVGLLLAERSPTSAHLMRAWRAARADPDLAPVLAPHEYLTPDRVAGILRECRRAGVTALVVHSDPEAVAVAQWCAERGVEIPGDLAIVAYDDETAHLAEPALTAVRPPKSHLGRLAVELMVARLLGGERRPAHRVLLAPDLVVRASSLTRP